TSAGTVKITDFGFAREIGKEASLRSTKAAGTLGYCPPEQARGQCDVRSDIYCFGTMLYDLVSGTDAPAYVTAVAKRCREFHPKDRFASVVEVREALQARGVEPVPRLTGLLAVSAVILIIAVLDRKSTRLNSSHVAISYAVLC